MRLSPIGRLAALLGLCSALTLLPAQAAEDLVTQAGKLRDATLADNAALWVVETVTTEVGPRLAGSDGDARGVAWAQKMMGQLGFSNIRTEPVRFARWRRGAESAEVLSPFPQKLAVTALGASIGTGGKPLTGELVVFTSLDALKAAKRSDVEGKIVYLSRRMRRAEDGGGYGETVGGRSSGAEVAAGLGAKALLIRSVGTDSDRLPHTGVGVSGKSTLADPAKLAKLAKTKSGIPINQTPIPAAAISNVDADLLGHMLERGGPVTVRLTLDAGFDGDYTSANVIGEIPGSDKADEIILLGAHLDSWDLGTGALDDGAGLGIVMGAARALKMAGITPRRTIRVVAYANEEQGGFGGHAYAEAHKAEAAKHVLGMEADLGCGRVRELSATIPAARIGEIDRMMQALAPLGVLRVAGSPEGGTDIAPMAQLGMPVVALHQDASRYFDLHHTANDTLDKVDGETLSQATAAFAVVLFMAAQAD